MDSSGTNSDNLAPLSQCVKDFVSSFTQSPTTFAVLYAPDKCYLGLVNASGEFEVKDNVDRFDVNKVFEARVFNAEKELRWLKGFGVAIISDASFAGDEFVEPLTQKYLIWGQSIEKSQDGWTRFGTARIGPFHVPIELKPAESYARFAAKEYLKVYKDGNVAVIDERLTGIEGYEGESKNG